MRRILAPVTGGGVGEEGVNHTEKTDKDLFRVCTLTKPLDARRRGAPNSGTFLENRIDKTDKTSAPVSAKIYAFVPKGTDKTDKTSRPDLRVVLDAYLGATVEIRPLPSSEDLAKHRKWLARSTDLFGKVNMRLPQGPLPPVRRLPVKLSSPASPGSNRSAVEPPACAHCGKHCSPSDMANWPRPCGSWVHLDCELRAAP
jgi:hypothetical protein